MSYLKDKHFRILRFSQIGSKRKPRWAWQYLTPKQGWSASKKDAVVIDYEAMSGMLVELRRSRATHRIEVTQGGNRGT